MALKCPECGTTAHARTSAYEAPSVKRSWYQCQNLECSYTFTALESVDTIIMKPRRNEQESEKAQMPENNSKLSIAMAPRQSCHAVSKFLSD